MSTFSYSVNHQTVELHNAFIINLVEYDKHGNYLPYLECAYIKQNAQEFQDEFELQQEILDIATKACICASVQQSDQDDNGFLNLEDKGNVFHISTTCIILDLDNHTVTTLGLMRNQNRCGLILQGLYQMQNKPNDAVVEALLKAPRKLTDKDKFKFALNEILEGTAVIYADSDEDLNKLCENHVASKHFLPVGITQFYKFYTITELGYIQPVKKRDQNWDIVYPASELCKMAQDIFDNYTLGLSQLCPGNNTTIKKE